MTSEINLVVGYVIKISRATMLELREIVLKGKQKIYIKNHEY